MKDIEEYKEYHRWLVYKRAKWFAFGLFVCGWVFGLVGLVRLPIDSNTLGGITLAGFMTVLLGWAIAGLIGMIALGFWATDD